MELAKIWKKTKNGFVKCRMKDLRKGDTFVYCGIGPKIKMVATSDPFLSEEGGFSIHARQ